MPSARPAFARHNAIQRDPRSAARPDARRAFQPETSCSGTIIHCRGRRHFRRYGRLAHITLETQEAKVGSTYKAVLRVPHGCDGKATTAVRVQIPEGVIAVKPMPKPGWKLETVKGKYAKSLRLLRRRADARASRKWCGAAASCPTNSMTSSCSGRMLTDGLAAGDDALLPGRAGMRDGATERWIEIPAKGQDEDALEFPAPGVKLLPKE